MADFLRGGRIDAATHERTDKHTIIGSGDFTTHGVIVGMTGSGKTGLGVVLIEEALRAGVPTLLIDPKGDLTNLCLTFPELAPRDFEPWVNPGDAEKAGQTVADYAAGQAETWTKGLAGWSLGGADIGALRQRVDFTVYTPGSTSGVPLDVVGSLTVPRDMSDLETVTDEVGGFVSGLLGLVGIDTDPLSSREHILLTNLIINEWQHGRGLDIPTLVGLALKPPIRKLGVFELDEFFPPNDRNAFAMRLNGLLASPSFGAWMSGSPLDIDTMLRTPTGAPRCAIITTAHLGDTERQFVTTLVLGKLVTWMRRQSGTTDLRALLYMDEVAGYLPPTANPPTKQPMMTLFKQARAFGVGVVVSTQNPVDVDYKALSNAGTWMIGRLQTERDKMRLLDGMSVASGGVDVNAVSQTISGLAKREFVLRRAGKDQPEVFTSRWAMSYLRGPLTRDQIATLMADQKQAPAAPTPAAPAPAPTGPVAPAGPTGSFAPPAPGTASPLPRPSPWREVSEGLLHAWRTPLLRAAMSVAALVNLTAFPLTMGLMPYTAKEVFHLDQRGLGWLVASFAFGALIGSLALSAWGRRLPQARVMLVASFMWYLCLAGFVLSPTVPVAMAMLVLAGIAQSLSMVSLSIVLLRTTEERFRGRIMGVRMLAIYTLPLGLMAAGALIPLAGYQTTGLLYAVIGLVLTLAIGAAWRHELLPRAAIANLA